MTDQPKSQRKETHKVCAGKQYPLSSIKFPIQQRLHLLTNATPRQRQHSKLLGWMKPASVYWHLTYDANIRPQEESQMGKNIWIENL